jgi:dihydrofolate synthase/folylpolyglutamate synthase
MCQERAAQLWTVGREWAVRVVEESPESTVFDVHGPAVAYERLRVPLAGAHQAANAATAVAALSALAARYPRVQADAIRRGLAATRWPGRLQVAARDPLVLLDAAHNHESAAALAGALARLYPAQPFVLVVAIFRDKDAGAVLAPLLPLASRVLCATADHPRALPAATLAEAARSLGAEAETSPSVAAALERARALAGPRGRVLVTGSLRTVGEAMMELGTSVVHTLGSRGR